MDEYIMQLGKALYDPDTGAAVFKPEFREKIIRCYECRNHDSHEHRCKYWNHGVEANGFCHMGKGE